MPTINEELRNRSVAHAIGVHRYATGSLSRVLALLDRADSDFVDALRPAIPTLLARPFAGTSKSLLRVEARLRRLLKKRQALLEPVRLKIREEVLSFLAYELQFHRKMVEGSIATVAGPEAAEAFGVRAPRLGAVRTQFLHRPMVMGKTSMVFREGVRQFVNGDGQRIRQAILAGVASQDPKAEVIRKVVGRSTLGYTDGTLHQTRRGLETLLRTSIPHAQQIADGGVAKANGKALRRYQWVSVLDGRTSDICIALSGQVFVVGMGPRPPAHHQCRSTTCPVIDARDAADRIKVPTVRDARAPYRRELDFREEAARTGRSVDAIRREWAKAAFGEAPLGTTYSDWLKAQPKWFQDDVLGPSRAAAFRRGELNLTRFVDTTGRRYTLEELAKRDGVEIPLRRRPDEELSKDLVLRGDPRRKDWEVAGPRQRG